MVVTLKFVVVLEECDAMYFVTCVSTLQKNMLPTKVHDVTLRKTPLLLTTARKSHACGCHIAWRYMPV